MKVLVFLMIPSFMLAEQSWFLNKDNNGVQVYSRETKGSEYRTFKGVVRINASMMEVVAVLKNIETYQKWFAYTKKVKLLKKEKNIQYLYLESEFPWPYRNRDMVYLIKFTQINPSAINITLTGVPNYIAAKKGIVRMKQAGGSLLLTAQDNKIEVVYVFHSEPGGNIPIWLANKALLDLPFKTLRNLNKLF